MVNLLDPLKIRGFVIKNRIVMPPMATNLAKTSGAVSEDLINHYIHRSTGLGLLIIEFSYPTQRGKLGERQLGIHHDRLLPGLRELTSRIHATGTLTVIQINPGRSATMWPSGTMDPPIRTSSHQDLTVEEIKELEKAMATAAERAVKAGFDGVEIHGAHQLLLTQFFSPLTNKRKDQYGGSLEKRMRFPLETVKQVKRKIGSKLLLYRLGAVDLNPLGIQIEDAKKLATKLVEEGVDILDVSGGMCGDCPPTLRGRPGFFIPQAQAIKEAVEAPVIGVGEITDPTLANKLIIEKRVDLVAVGRALLRDPNWAINALQSLKVK